MAHIADLMVEAETTTGLNNYIARELSPSPVQEAAPEVPQIEDKDKFVWRMHQPTEGRKYQLFPTKDKLPLTAQKSQEDMLTTGTSDKVPPMLGTSGRPKVKEQTLVRRRKVSVPELGPTPMTTVQEISMDSPTIPGRPALHERSISAPGNSWRQHPFGESMLSCISGPALDENAEMILDNSAQEENLENHVSRTFTGSPLKQPLSPKTLTPLVIPTSSSDRLNGKNSSSRLRSESIPPDVPPKSTRMREGTSPYPRASPYTPMSASSTSLLSASTAPTSVSNTPNSAFPPLLEGRTTTPYPQPWSSTTTLVPPVPTRSITPTPNFPSSAGGLSCNQSDAETLHHQPRSFPHAHTHRRHDSESAASIMDRGRPKKRSDTSPSASASPIKAAAAASRSQSKSGRSHSASNSTSTVSPPAETSPEKEKEQAASAAKSQAKAEAQHAFEHLPTGIRPHLTPNHLPLSELAFLKKQALGQASRFQVLPAHSVDTLSRELRALDERCEYLRKTHRSLRSGRRNLHERICNYLRGERTAVFSRESLLRQEEALSELDNSIDDWVAKLEQAENRRTRVRQKLLEHVAAALIIPEPPASGLGLSNLTAMVSSSTVGVAKAHVVTMAVSAEVPADPNTPPRSPTKGQSPERLDRVVGEVKFSSPEPKRGGRHVESIRIYADSDVYALLADVEEEIVRMGKHAAEREKEEEEGREREREREREGEMMREMEKKVRIKKDDVLSPGITLHAVAFEGMIAHKRSYGTMRT